MNQLSRLLHRDLSWMTVLFAISFAAYRSTTCPTVSFIDCGELAAAAVSLGIAHPTGYPLFTLLGRLTTMLPLGFEEIELLNLFGGLVTACAAAIFYTMVLELQRIPSAQAAGRERARTDVAMEFRVAAFAGSLTFAFVSTVWAQSVAVEVYSLHLLLTVLVLATFLKGLRESVEAGDESSRFLFLSFFLLGLSFGNHMTTLLLLPGMAYLFISMLKPRRPLLPLVPQLSLFLVLGLSVYAYLPIRSGVGPPLDWGHPVDLERLLWHVTGKQYRSWIFSSVESAGKQLEYFVNRLAAEFHWVALGVLAIGVWCAVRGQRRRVVFLTILFLSCVGYAINYDIHDIDSYFLLAYVAAAALLVYGLEAVVQFIVKTSGRSILVAVVASLAVPIVQFASNRTAVDESDNYLLQDYTENILNNLDSNAVVFSFQWDYFVSPALYYQVVRGMRKDVVIIDKELLRRSWYFIHLGRQYPWLIERSKGMVGAFLIELNKFERGEPYNPHVIEARFVEMINDLIYKASIDRPVYVGPEMEREFAEGFQRNPAGLLFRLSREGTPAPTEVPVIRYRDARIENRWSAILKSTYAQMLTFTAVRLQSEGKPEYATELLQKALQISPSYQAAASLLRLMPRPGGMPAERGGSLEGRGESRENGEI